LKDEKEYVEKTGGITRKGSFRIW